VARERLGEQRGFLAETLLNFAEYSRAKQPPHAAEITLLSHSWQQRSPGLLQRDTQGDTVPRPDTAAPP